MRLYIGGAFFWEVGIGALPLIGRGIRMASLQFPLLICLKSAEISLVYVVMIKDYGKIARESLSLQFFVQITKNPQRIHESLRNDTYFYKKHIDAIMGQGACPHQTGHTKQ